jgi:hypothetical protein
VRERRHRPPVWPSCPASIGQGEHDAQRRGSGRFSGRFDRTEACRKLGLDPERRRLLFCGSLNVWQGVDFAVRALEKLLEENADLSLHIVGDGPSARKSKSWPSRAGGKGEKSSCTGTCRTRPCRCWIGACDVCLLPKRPIEAEIRAAQAVRIHGLRQTRVASRCRDWKPSSAKSADFSFPTTGRRARPGRARAAGQPGGGGRGWGREGAARGRSRNSAGKDREGDRPGVCLLREARAGCGTISSHGQDESRNERLRQCRARRRDCARPRTENPRPDGGGGQNDGKGRAEPAPESRGTHERE